MNKILIVSILFLVAGSCKKKEFVTKNNTLKKQTTSTSKVKKKIDDSISTFSNDTLSASIKKISNKESISSSNDTITSNLSAFNGDFIDLSRKKLKKMPDLSKHSARFLDISYNDIEEITLSYLPKGIKKINFSNNQLKKVQVPKIDKTKSIEYIDVSNNDISSISIAVKIQTIIANNNNLTYISFPNYGQVKYVNISNNKNLSNIVQFEPKGIPQLIYKNIKNSKPLISAVDYSLQNYKID